jgi:hypothetical protein
LHAIGFFLNGEGSDSCNLSARRDMSFYQDCLGLPHLKPKNMKILLTALAAVSFILANGQYTSPDESLNLTLDDLVEDSEGAVVFVDDTYEIYEDITIALSDTLIIDDASVVIADSVLITIEGGFYCTTSSFTQLNCCDAYYEGFRFEETAVADIFNTSFLYGGGIQVLTGDFRMEASNVSFQSTGQTTSAALDLSTGKPKIINSNFLENEVAAIGSAANSDPAPLIQGCTFNGNVTGNTNRPQVNLGPSGADTAIVRQNVFLGNPELTNVGGFSFSQFLNGEGHLVFKDNVVSGNRYGVNVFGSNITSHIQDNVLQNNNTQNEPNLGGSGISISGFGENSHVILGNLFEGNLWGITLLENAQANLGEIENPEIGAGGNLFNNNGNGGEIYALFNNTANTVYAQGNCWDTSDEDPTLAEAEAVISHVVDDPELGEVIFDPLGSCSILSTQSKKVSGLKIYPNPGNGNLYVSAEESLGNIEVIDLSGKRVFQLNLNQSNSAQLDLTQLPDGFYLIRVESATGIQTQKLSILH